MAKIALIAAGIAAGIFLSVATGGAGFAALGFMIGKLAGDLLFPGNAQATGPRLSDAQVSSSTNGAPIPFGYGGFRIGGQIVWSGGIQETKTVTTQSAKGGPSQTTTTYSYTISFAAVFCEGPAKITRIWADSRVIYDVTSKGAISSPTLSTGIGTHTTTILPTIYPGDENQLPDPTIQAKEGAPATSAMRGLCYLVYEDLPLADFGNRLPNIRAEISTGTTNSFMKDTYPPAGVFDPFQSTGLFPPSFPRVDAASRCVYIFDQVGMVVQKIDLSADNTAPVQRWQKNTAYNVGDQVLDSNGNVETCFLATGDSGNTEPSPWPNAEGLTTIDNHVRWINVGAGPEAVVVTAKGAIQPLISGVGANTFSSENSATNLGVDTAGFLWVNGSTSPVPNINGKPFQLVQVDPNSFVVKRWVGLDAAVAAWQAVKTNDGRDLVYVTTQSNFGLGNKLIVIDAHSGSILRTSSPWAPVSPDPAINYTGNITVDPATGTAYCITFGSSSNGAWAINIIDAHGNYSEHSYTEGVVTGFGNDYMVSCLFNSADKSLICFSVFGAMAKVDLATMTITERQPANTLIGQAPDQALPPTAYVAGNVPGGGVFYVPGFQQPGNVPAIAEVNAATLTIESLTPLSSWGPFVSSTVFTGYSFDPVTTSLVICNNANVSYRLYLNRQSVNAETLDLVVADILTRAGMTPDQFDVSALSGISVFGYPIARATDAKSILSPLCMAYFFDLVETEFKLKAVLRGGNTSVTIPESDLGVSESKGNTFELQTVIAQQHDLPKDVTVLYADPALDYQQGKQMRRRHTKVVKTKNQSTIELPLTLHSDDAAQIAQKALSQIWSERNQYSWKLWKAKYLVIDPSDLVQFTYGSKPYQSRILKTNVGQNRQMEIDGVSENSLAYVSSVAGVKGSGFPAQILGASPSTLLFLLDLPLLQDTDAPPSGSTGFYWAMSSPGKGWPGGVLFNSSDNQTFNPLDFANNEVSYGAVSDIFQPPRSTMSWDFQNKIVVRMTGGATLSSTSALNVLNGANAFILGNEVAQFQNATLNADGTYTLDTFLRGRRGTEGACSKHVQGETFIYLGTGTGLHRTLAATSLVDALRYYKGVTIGQTISSVFPQQMALQGSDLKPYAPAQLGGTRDALNNFNITWTRRTRIGGAWLNGPNTGTVPLNEDTESYDVEFFVLNGNGKDPLPFYTVSPTSAVLFRNIPVSTGGGVTNENEGGISPNVQVTFADGHTATYNTSTATVLPIPYWFATDHPQGSNPNPVLVPGTTYYITVFDPAQLGDPGPGTTLNYFIDPTPVRANTPGYILLGTIHPTDNNGNGTVGPGGSYNVIRTFSGLGSPNCTYTAAQQTADYGSVQSFLRCRVFQNSAQVGRGFPTESFRVGSQFGYSATGSGDASSIQGVPVSPTVPTDGQVLTYSAADTQAEWKTPFSTARQTINKTTGSLAVNASETGTMTMGCKSFMVLRASTTKQCRIQLYSTAALRDADAGRAFNTEPVSGSQSGVIMDLQLTDVETWVLSSALPGSNMESSPSQTIAYRITNLDTSAGAVPVTLTILPLES